VDILADVAAEQDQLETILDGLVTSGPYGDAALRVLRNYAG
jgi:hypothetical protein